MIGKVLGKGRTATVFEYNGNAIKIFNKGFYKGSIEREYRYSKIASDHNCNVPVVHKFLEIDGCYAIETDKIIGKTFSELQLENTSEGPKFAKLFSEIQADYHKVEVEENDLNSFFIDRLDHVKDLSKEQITQIKNYTMKLPISNHLCHGDYHPGNIMISNDKPYLIDWMNGYFGNPLSDVCRTYLMMHSPDALASIPDEFKKDGKEYIREFLKVYISNYCKITDLKEEDIYDWLLPVAALRLLENIPFEKEWLLGIINERL